jgi:hypothetical protein
MYRWNYVFISPIFFFQVLSQIPLRIKKKHFYFFPQNVKHPWTIYYLHFIHQFKWTLHSRAIFSISGLRSRMFYVLRKEIKMFFLNSEGNLRQYLKKKIGDIKTYWTKKLEAQWAEPVSLTFHSALKKLNSLP